MSRWFRNRRNDLDLPPGTQTWEKETSKVQVVGPAPQDKAASREQLGHAKQQLGLQKQYPTRKHPVGK